MRFADRNVFSKSCARLAFVLSCVAFCGPIGAQTGAWPILILEPPGADVAKPVLVDVAISANTAVLAYGGAPTQRVRIYLAASESGVWSAAQLLVEASTLDGQAVVVDADLQRLAIGLPDANGNGRVDIYRRASGTWTFEQSIDPPVGVTSFGRTLSIHGDVLVVSVVSSFGGGGLESYRRSAGTGIWEPAGFSVSGPFQGAEYFAHTDGERIAACLEMVCRTFVSDGSAQWNTEASVAGSAAPVAVAGGWLFVRTPDESLRIHRRVDDEWVPTQTIDGVRNFEISDAGLLVRLVTSGRMSLHAPNESGVWIETSQLDIPYKQVPSLPIAWNGSSALIGGQSFSVATGAWLASGVVGLSDLSNARFGASLGIARSRLWIGSPGLSSGDRGAGGVWIHALPGATLPSAGPLVPPSPALARGFGAAISVDMTQKLAIASRTQTTVAPHELRVALYDGATPMPLAPANEILMPPTSSTIQEIDVARDVNSFALTRKMVGSGILSSDVLIYSNSGNGFQLTQTIVLPNEGSWPDFGYGSRVVADDDRMVAGVRGYSRINQFQDYELTARLPLTLSDVPIASGLAASEHWVVVPMTDDFGTSVARVYAWTTTGGWGPSWRVMKNGFTISGGCTVVAIDADDTIACVVAGAGGRPEIYRATRADASSDWRITAGGPVPGPGHSSRFTLAMRGDIVYVGWPQTGPGLAGENVGRVVGMTFNETIFRAGFEWP